MIKEESIPTRTQRTESKARGRWGVYLLVGLLLCSVIINVLLAQKLNHLRYVEATLRAEGTLQPETLVPVIEAKDLDGNTVSFPYGDSELPLVIYVLSPTCTWCKKNQNNAETLAKNVSGKYRFIALSLTPNGLKEYLANRRISFPVYSYLSNDTTSAYNLGATPKQLSYPRKEKYSRIGQGRMLIMLSRRLKAISMFDFRDLFKWRNKHGIAFSKHSNK